VSKAGTESPLAGGAIADVADGIIEIQLPLPGKPTIVNVYVVDLRNGEWAVVDTGTAHENSLETFFAALKKRRIDPSQIRHVLATHHHPDHFGASNFLVRECGAQIYMHPKERELIGFMQAMDPMAMLEHVRRHGIPIPEKPMGPASPRDSWSEGFKPAPQTDHELRDGEVLSLGRRDFRVIHTPGHTSGHCCFLLPDSGTFLVGDHLLPRITPHIGVFAGGPSNPLGDFMASQEKCAALEDIKIVGPAHGRIYSDHCHRARQLIEHHEYRMREMLDFIRKQPANAFQVAENSFQWVFQGDPEAQRFNRGAAVMETIAHLNLLEAREDARSEERDGVVFFRATS
jgi:glyoxylase-like metal-dependent hydrolase (beta-lactamase superfamily II)